MLTDRDKRILRFIEKYKAISTQQADAIFFQCERSCIRRMNQLEDLKILDSYYIGKNKIYKYPEERKISQHDLYILDFYAWVYREKGDVLDFQLTPHYLKGILIPDALCKFKIDYEGTTYTANVLLEIDYTHYTEVSKLNTWYEKLYKEETLKEYCGQAEFPIVVIARPTRGLIYKSNNFEILYTDFKFNNLVNFIFN